MQFLKENERVRIYITANSLKNAAPRRLRRYLLLGNVEGGSPRLLTLSSLHEKLHATNSLAFARFNSLTFVLDFYTH